MKRNSSKQGQISPVEKGGSGLVYSFNIDCDNLGNMWFNGLAIAEQGFINDGMQENRIHALQQ